MVDGEAGRRLDPVARRAELLAAAQRLAAGGDVTQVSVRAIAAEAGVSLGLLYHYFPTREDLLVAAVRQSAGTLVEAMERAFGTPATTPLDALGAGLAAFLDHVQEDPTGWLALLSARSGALAEVGEEVETRLRTVTLHALGVTDPSPALEATLDGWAALEREACRTWLARPGLSRAALEDLLESAFLGALAAAARHDEQAARVLETLAGAG